MANVKYLSEIEKYEIIRTTKYIKTTPIKYMNCICFTYSIKRISQLKKLVYNNIDLIF